MHVFPRCPYDEFSCLLLVQCRWDFVDTSEFYLPQICCQHLHVKKQQPILPVSLLVPNIIMSKKALVSFQVLCSHHKIAGGIQCYQNIALPGQVQIWPRPLEFRGRDGSCVQRNVKLKMAFEILFACGSIPGIMTHLVFIELSMNIGSERTKMILHYFVWSRVFTCIVIVV